MTKIDIEQIKADREAGTRGPWKVQRRKTPWELSSGKAGHHSENWIFTAHDQPQLKAPDPVVAMSRGIGTPESGPVDLIWLREEDARRIVRVPDMEDALIEAKSTFDAIVQRSHDDPLGTSKVIDMRKIAEQFLERFK